MGRGATSKLYENFQLQGGLVPLTHELFNCTFKTDICMTKQYKVARRISSKRVKISDMFTTRLCRVGGGLVSALAAVGQVTKRC